MKTRKLTAEGQRLVSKGSNLARRPNCHFGRGGGLVRTNFQLLMLHPNLLKSQNPITVGEGEGVGDDQFPTFDAESKSAKKSHYGGRVGDDQFLTFYAKSKVAIIPKSH